MKQVKNPDTNRWVNVDGKVGIKILSKYGKSRLEFREDSMKPVAAAVKSKSPSTKVPHEHVNQVMNLVALKADAKTLARLRRVNKDTREAALHPAAVATYDAAKQKRRIKDLASYMQYILQEVKKRKHVNELGFELKNKDGKSLVKAHISSGIVLTLNDETSKRWIRQDRDAFVEIATEMLKAKKVTQLVIDIFYDKPNAVYAYIVLLTVDLTKSTYSALLSAQTMDNNGEYNAIPLDQAKARMEISGSVVDDLRTYGRELYDILL